MTIQTLIPLNQHQTGKPNVFCVHPMGGGSEFYKNIAALTQIEVNLFALEEPYLYDHFDYDSLPELAEYHVENILEVQPQGPFNILGYCSGTMVAYEIAVQLELQGFTVKVDLLGGLVAGNDELSHFGFLAQYLEHKLSIDLSFLEWSEFEKYNIDVVAKRVYEACVQHMDFEMTEEMACRYIKALYFFRHGQKKYQPT